jgi:DNA-binding response OmpR family regulator
VTQWKAEGVAAPDHGTVVVVEDDPHIADLVAMYLRQDGFRVLLADDGERGLALIERERPRIVLLDLGLPGAIDGLEVCRRLRAGGRPGTPVLILTARDSETDRVVGLELGADDYVTKPFSPREVLARVRAILRRTEAAAPAAPVVLSVGAITLDQARREVTRDGRPAALTAREFDLLAHLMGNDGLVLSRRQLLDAVWGGDWVGDERTVDVHVAQLRRKLGDDMPLTTVWGVGYRMG